MYGPESTGAAALTMGDSETGCGCGKFGVGSVVGTAVVSGGTSTKVSSLALPEWGERVEVGGGLST